MINPADNRKKKDAGFTLIEVLVSLMIFSVAILGLSRAQTEMLRSTRLIADKTQASIVAENQMILARHTTPKVGVRKGRERSGGRDFDFEIETTETELDGFLRIEVRVSDSETDLLLYEIEAFRTVQ